MLERIELVLFRDIGNLFVLLGVAGNCEAISPRRQFQIPPFDASEASQHLWLVWEDRSHSKRLHHVHGLNAQLFKWSLCDFTAKNGNNPIHIYIYPINTQETANCSQGGRFSHCSVTGLSADPGYTFLISHLYRPTVGLTHLECPHGWR